MGEQQSFKEKLRAGEICIGTWVSFTDPCVTELLCGSGFDFLIVDAEHGPHDLESIMMHMMAAKGRNTTPLVRVPWNDPIQIKRVLDVGAAGVLVPMVRTEEDVRQAVAACMYPPEGIRGYGPRRPSDYERRSNEYIAAANRNMIVIVQIEHADSIRNLEGILQVPGLDGVFIGLADLSASLGVLGQPTHGKVVEAVEAVIAKAHQFGVPVGLTGPCTPEGVWEWIAKGIQFITAGSDTAFLVSIADSTVAAIRKYLH